MSVSSVNTNVSQGATFGARLKWFREFKGMTVRQFAARLGCAPSYLSKLETGKARNPSARFVGTVVSTFRAREKWLVDGDGDPFITGSTDARTKEALPDWSNARLQRVFAILDELPDALAPCAVVNHLLQGHSLDQLQELWHAMMDALYPTLPAPARLFWNQVYAELQMAKQDADFRRKLNLTHPETSHRVPTVKPQLPSLLERLKKTTAASGKKSELAEFLKSVTKSPVPLASVSRWLSGEREPGGEIALLMLKWVELQERKT